MSNDAPVDVLVRFTRSKDAVTLAANGVWGGLSPNGSVVAHFFLEQQVVPPELLLQVSPSGVVEKERRGDRGPNGAPLYLREIQATLMIRAEDCRSFGEWFLERARQFEQAAADTSSKQ